MKTLAQLILSVTEAAKTTGEYRKDALAREAEFRRSVAPRQKQLQGKPLQSRKRTMAQMAAGVAAHKKMQDDYEAITPIWKPTGMERSAGAYTQVGGLHDPWLRPTSESSKPTDLFFSHGGDHLAIHSTVNAGHPTGGRLHSDLPDFHRAEGQDPMIQGRIGHKGVDKDGKPKGMITYLSLQSRASGFGERTINAQKRRTANKLARMYPGYTHHDADDNMREF